jgi:hypothetical protein
MYQALTSHSRTASAMATMVSQQYQTCVFTAGHALFREAGEA